MNKEEIEKQIEITSENKKAIVGMLDSHIKELQIQLGQSEKPELRHGDFGQFRDEALLPRLAVMNKIYDHEGICGNKNYDICYNIFGNIFDLLKDEDFKEFLKRKQSSKE